MVSIQLGGENCPCVRNKYPRRLITIKHEPCIFLYLIHGKEKHFKLLMVNLQEKYNTFVRQWYHLVNHSLHHQIKLILTVHRIFDLQIVAKSYRQRTDENNKLSMTMTSNMLICNSKLFTLCSLEY